MSLGRMCLMAISKGSSSPSGRVLIRTCPYLTSQVFLIWVGAFEAMGDLEDERRIRHIEIFPAPNLI